MKKHKTLSILAILLFALTVTLSACSGDRNPGESHATNETQQGPSTGQTTNGGEIVVGIAQDLDASFDPHQMVAAGTAGTREVFFNVFEGLVRPNPEGDLIPAVAESFSVDGTVYTFVLREGVQFHNGDFVTVEDVVYSINRSADPERTTTFQAAFSVITRVEAIDQRTVEIEIAEIDHEFLAFLTTAIIPEGYENQATQPIGTGPFRFVSHSPQEALVLERFDDHWSGGAYLERVTFRIFGSGEALNLALSTGTIDLAGHLTQDMTRALPADFYYMRGAMNLVQALWLNNAVYPLDNPQVREAIAFAVDLRQIMGILADGYGHPIGSGVHPGLARYFHEGLVGWFDSEDHVHAQNAARDRLYWAGFPDGFDLTITVPSNYTPHVITAEIIAEQLRAVGINVRIDLVEWAFWVSEVNQGRNFEATVIGIAARDLTARSMLERWVSDNSRNFINFNSPAYDAVFAQAQSTHDPEEQVELYRRLQEILVDEVASVFLQDLNNFVAIRNTLAGFTFYPIYVIDLSTIHFVN